MDQHTKNLQAKLDETQALYREWLDAKQQADEAYAAIEHAMAVMKKLEAAYFDETFIQLHDADAKGLLDTTTLGEYSVLSEDAVYNALIDKEQLLWAHLKLCIEHLQR